MRSSLTSEKQKKLLEYENYIFSVKPLSMEQVHLFDQARNKMQNLWGAFFIFGLISLLSMFYVLVAFQPHLGIYASILFIMLAALMYAFLYILSFRRKYNNRLVPFGLNIDDIYTNELTLVEYHKISTIDHPELLKAISEIIQYRNGALLAIDLKALRIDRYFALIQPDFSGSPFAENKKYFLKQILDKTAVHF